MSRTDKTAPLQVRMTWEDFTWRATTNSEKIMGVDISHAKRHRAKRSRRAFKQYGADHLTEPIRGRGWSPDSNYKTWLD